MTDYDSLEPLDQKDAYARSAAVCEVFWEWRHKIMVFTLSIVSGLLAVAGWMFDRDLHRAVSGPLFLGSVIAASSTVFDLRNEEILRRSLDLAGKLEEAMGFTANDGPLGRVTSGRTGLRALFLTYHGVLRLGFILISVAFFLLGIFVLVANPAPAAR